MSDYAILRRALWDLFHYGRTVEPWERIKTDSRNKRDVKAACYLLADGDDSVSLLLHAEEREHGFMHDEFLSTNYADGRVMARAAEIQYGGGHRANAIHWLRWYAGLLAIHRTPDGPVPVGGRHIFPPPSDSQRAHASILHNGVEPPEMQRWWRDPKVEHIDKMGAMMLADALADDRSLSIFVGIPWQELLEDVVLPAPLEYATWPDGSWASWLPQGTIGILSPQFQQNPIVAVVWNAAKGEVRKIDPANLGNGKRDKSLEVAVHRVDALEGSLVAALDRHSETVNLPQPLSQSHSYTIHRGDVEHGAQPAPPTPPPASEMPSDLATAAESARAIVAHADAWGDGYPHHERDIRHHAKIVGRAGT